MLATCVRRLRTSLSGRYAATVACVLAYVGLGANLGSREVTIRRAIDLLGQVEGIELVAVSRLRETVPWGPVEQPAFLNGAAALETELEPETLLEAFLEIERQLGRRRDETTTERWGPRVIDLDLLLYGELVVDRPGLVVPHPLLHERRFALEPLAELAPEAVVPGQGTVSALLAALDDAG